MIGVMGARRRSLGAIAMGVWLAATTAPSPSSADSPAPLKPAEEAAYGLDGVSRDLVRGVPFACPKVDLVDYKGDVVKIWPQARIYTGFRDKLVAFEKVVREVGVEVYGRAPTRIVSLGTYACRHMSAYTRLLSEHGLGNAIDVAGFDFGALPKDAALPAGLDRTFKNGFEVRVDKHFSASFGYAAVHARFLKTLARRLIGRKDIFRVLLGPGYHGHKNHFHFDMAPYRLVQIFDKGALLTPLP